MKTAALLLTLSITALAVDELPQRDGREALDFEPSLRLTDVKPETGGKAVPWETPLPDLDKARVDAENARRKADRWQQLQRKGVGSKAEAERAGLLAVRASLRYQQAHVAAQKTRLASLQERVARKETSPDLLATAQNDLTRSEQLLADAEALAKRTDLEFAQNQFDRQRKLVAAGIGSKNLLQKAKADLERAQSTPAPR